ncbi:MAG TPA: DUF4349 domain-containing protein, partial [Catenuloplanes sp.]
MTVGRGRRWSAGLGLAAMLATLALTGCSGDEKASTGADSAAPREVSGARAGAGNPAAPEKAQVAEGQPPAAAPAQDGQPVKAPTDLRVDQRAIIYTGTITVRVTNVDEAAAKATAIATGAGGFVGADKRTSG